LTKVDKPNWKIVEGVLVEHATTPGGGSYCIYRLESTRGEVLYASTRLWKSLEFRLSWPDMPGEMLSDWQYFTTLEEARRWAGNIDNEERGIQPFEVDTSRYTPGPELHYCLCCGYRTIEGYKTDHGYTKPPETYDICPICFWQDDRVATRFPDEAIGPNGVSLNEARRNFQEFGASERVMLQHVRPPNEGEERDPDWKLVT
jgi:hypothetical protein